MSPRLVHAEREGPKAGVPVREVSTAPAMVWAKGEVVVVDDVVARGDV